MTPPVVSPAKRTQGSCRCGRVRYAIGTPIAPATMCHCRSCQKIAGAHAVAWLTVPLETWEILCGSTNAFRSAEHVERQFCSQCGSPLTYWSASSPVTIDITVATLDHPDEYPPEDHIWMEDALSWDHPNDGLACHPRERTRKSPTTIGTV